MAGQAAQKVQHTALWPRLPAAMTLANQEASPQQASPEQAATMQHTELWPVMAAKGLANQVASPEQASPEQAAGAAGAAATDVQAELHESSDSPKLQPNFRLLGLPSLLSTLEINLGAGD